MGSKNLSLSAVLGVKGNEAGGKADFIEQDSAAGANFASMLIFPYAESCWGVAFPEPCTSSQAPYRSFPLTAKTRSPRAKMRLLLRETTEVVVFAEESRAARSNASLASFSPQSLGTLWGPLIKNANVSDLVHWHFCF